MSREADRQQLPASMRRDVRLLGDLLGEASGEGPRRESLAAAVAELSAEPGGHRLDDLLSRLRVHPVLTAHPTEARRRAVATALRRIASLIDALDDEHVAAGHTE